MGAAVHNFPEGILDAAKDRSAVAGSVQQHLVRPWERWHTTDHGGILACKDDMAEARAASGLAGDCYGDAGAHIEDDE